ncbi:MAG: hydrolase TatD [Desulfobacterales bacterium GWB2_56_26]|nr:MAG: hydrolase TatD [Desulfobacterales bacterium GWB2_56_26]
MNSTDIFTPDTQDCRFIDTHCHLDMDAFAEDLDEVLERAIKAGVDRIVTIGIDLRSSAKAIALADKYPQLSATIGVHPHDVEGLQDNDYASLERLYVDHCQSIVAFGEIGLDYYKNYADPAVQRKHYARQLDLAHELKLPVIIHNRDADEDILNILRQAKSLDYGGIMHCFSGDLALAGKIIDLGMLISIPGVVTFKNSVTLQEVAKNIPLASMVIETDGPFLAPHPYRGKRNEPSYVVYTAQKIAELRGIDLPVIADQTTANSQKIFQLQRR